MTLSVPFNFLVMYPVGIPTLVALAFTGDSEVLVPGAVLLFGVVLFSVALASLIRTARQLALMRLAGVQQTDAPSLWIEGGRAVGEAARQGRNPHARLAAYILAAAGFGWLASLAFEDERIRWLSLGIGLVGALLFEYGQRKGKQG